MLKHTFQTRQADSQILPQTHLAIHSQRRGQGTPVLTVLTGTLNDTQEIWCRWIQQEGRDTVIWTPRMTKPLPISWLEKLLARPDLKYQLLLYLAKISHYAPEDLILKLANKSSYELDIFQQQLPVQLTTQGSLLLKWFLTQITLSRELTSDLALNLAQAIQLEDDQNLAQGIMTFIELLPAAILPGLLVEVTDDELLQRPFIRILAQIAERLPEMPIALSIMPAHFENYCTKAPESRIKAMLRQNVIETRSHTNSRGTLPDKTDRILQQYSAPIQLYEEAKSLLQLIADKKDDPSLARSQAEQFLFHMLEWVPETRGVFQLNVKMPFKFGNRPMEIDLFATSDQIALEIDGYYHFQDSESWRRDRRKDFILQMHGILVLRFLAEDVVSRLDEILDAVRQALQHRRQIIN
ncbi:MAG: DUF559 domain-containing protein [Nitrosomonas halophila]